MKLKRTTLISILAVLLVVGCTAQQWFQIVQALLPVVTDTTLAFLTYSNTLKGGSLTAAQAAAISNYSTAAQTIIGDIGQDVTSVQMATTNEAKIQALLANLKMQSAALIPDLGIKDSATLAATQEFINVILTDAGDIANIVPAIKGQPVATLADASRVSGWPEASFILVQTSNKTIAVASQLTLRQLQRKFAARQNAIRSSRTGNMEVDAALAAVPKAKSPSALGSLIRGQKP